MFIPSYSYIEARQPISNVMRIKRIAFYGFTFGLMTPVLVLLILFVPVILNMLGIHEGSYSKSVLELSSKEVETYLFCMVPVAMYGAMIFVIYHFFHKIIFFLYMNLASPLWKEIKTYFSDIFRY